MMPMFFITLLRAATFEPLRAPRYADVDGARYAFRLLRRFMLINIEMISLRGATERVCCFYARLR